MDHRNEVCETSNIRGVLAGGATNTPTPSDRELRAVRRGMGIPVSTSSSREFLTQGRQSKRKIDSDTGSEEDSCSDGYTTSEDEYSSSDDRQLPIQRSVAATAIPRRANNIILLHDSRFSPDRTDMRLWHELRYVRSLWSREEEEKLRNDCLAITDGHMLNSVSNSVLWTAAFDRFGVPLSDVFTYGLRPHPGNLRFPRKKFLGPQFCDHLAAIMVHPIFKGDVASLRYVLQLVVRMRVGIHVPPMGTMPDMDDADLDDVKFLAHTLLLEEETPESRLLVHSDAYLFISQQHGPRFHPDMVMLKDLLTATFSKEGYASTAPRDDAPHSASLFYLQLWDLKFLLGVLNGLSVGSSYLPAERYKTWWLCDTYKIQQYIANKLDSLIQQWFITDERNYRIRKKLKEQDSDTRLYDIPEEDFNPAYARSQYVTRQMRAVFEGDYLEALCPPDPPVGQGGESPVGEVPTAAASFAEGSVAEGLSVRDQELGSDTDATQSPRATNSTHSRRDSPAMSIGGDDSSSTIEVLTLGEQQASPEAEIKLEAEGDSDDETEYESSGEDGEGYNEHPTDHGDSKYQERSRQTALATVLHRDTSPVAAYLPHIIDEIS
ncbi:hypothetical protein DHEL01_v211535 [Diaporthe helianthi]|uniref:Uncharacterized protein n=1 Tax=Diaporthe helianthi TaxID=158607 RepID=A0A2P5HIJ1_DIAHE|nr:hypothetical protein DHEL01_v211535 [Diaporthe helianthi]